VAAVPPTTAYSYAQLEQLWINNGGSSASAPVAAAVAYAESNGVPGATSLNPDGGVNVGLWQLDTPGGGGAGFTQAQLADPNLNAATAVRVSRNGADWSTWATYASGAYRAFLSPGTTPDPNVPAASAATSATAQSAASASTCLVGFTAPSVLGIGGGTVCILSKANMRSIAGAAMLVSGGFLVFGGAVLLAAVGLGATGVAGRAAGLLPETAEIEQAADAAAARGAMRAPATGRHAAPAA